MIKEVVFDTVNLSIIVCTILIFIGWIHSTPHIFKLASFIAKVLVGFFLVIRFGIMKREKLDAFEKKLCFVAGMYLLVFTIGDYVRSFAYAVRPEIQKTGLIPLVPGSQKH